MDIYLVLLFLVTTVALPLVTSTPGQCEVVQDGQNRPISCTPCNIGKPYDHEVHVRNIATDYKGTAKVTISLRSGVSPRPLRLLLISKVHLQWDIDLSSNLVGIDKVVTMSSDGFKSTLNYSMEFKLLKPTHIHKDTSEMTRDPSQVSILLLEKGLGEMTSYEADFSSKAAFGIRLGECDAVKPDIRPSGEELQCLANYQCLIEARFNYNKDRTNCSGKSYITKYSSLYVGIVLCTSNRYKLYMSNLLRGPFLDIADRVPTSNYYGTDHCQVFGRSEERGDETLSRSSHTFTSSVGCTSGYGFYREHINQIFQFGKICGADHSVDYTGRMSPSWYQCFNVQIPGDFDIIKASWQSQQSAEDTPGTSTPKILSTTQGTTQNLVTIIIPVVLGVVITLVVIVLVVIYYRRLLKQRRSPSSSLSPRRDSRDLLQDTSMDMACRPPAELPPEALQVTMESEGKYCYVGFNEPPHHCPEPPCNSGVMPVSGLQEPHQTTVPNVYTSEPDKQRLQNNLPISTVSKLVTVPKIQTMPEVLIGTEYENSPSTQTATPGLLQVPKHPNIPSAPSTPTPQKKPRSPLVAKKPIVPKAPPMTQHIIIPSSPKVLKKPINPKTHEESETGRIITAAQNMVPRGFLNELITHLPTRADKTVKDGTPYDNQDGDEEEYYLEIMDRR